MFFMVQCVYVNPICRCYKACSSWCHKNTCTRLFYHVFITYVYVCSSTR